MQPDVPRHVGYGMIKTLRCSKAKSAKQWPKLCRPFPTMCTSPVKGHTRPLQIFFYNCLNLIFIMEHLRKGF